MSPVQVILCGMVMIIGTAMGQYNNGYQKAETTYSTKAASYPSQPAYPSQSSSYTDKPSSYQSQPASYQSLSYAQQPAYNSYKPQATYQNYENSYGYGAGYFVQPNSIATGYRNDLRQQYVNDIAHSVGSGVGTAPVYGVPGTGNDFDNRYASGYGYNGYNGYNSYNSYENNYNNNNKYGGSTY